MQSGPGCSLNKVPGNSCAICLRTAPRNQTNPKTRLALKICPWLWMQHAPSAASFICCCCLAQLAIIFLRILFFVRPRAPRASAQMVGENSFLDCFCLLVSILRALCKLREEQLVSHGFYGMHNFPDLHGRFFHVVACLLGKVFFIPCQAVVRGKEARSGAGEVFKRRVERLEAEHAQCRAGQTPNRRFFSPAAQSTVPCL